MRGYANILYIYPIARQKLICLIALTTRVYPIYPSRALGLCMALFPLTWRASVKATGLQRATSMSDTWDHFLQLKTLQLHLWTVGPPLYKQSNRLPNQSLESVFLRFPKNTIWGHLASLACRWCSSFQEAGSVRYLEGATEPWETVL